MIKTCQKHIPLMLKFHFVFLFLLKITLSYSQFENLHTTENISINNGLTQVTVFSILKDSRGFFWFGTLDGLNRYDGYEMRTFKNDPSNKHSISSNQIQCIYEDSKQNIWISTGSGINKFNPRTEQFIAYTLGSINQFFAKTILEDDKGDIWIGVSGYNSGVAKLNQNTSTFDFVPYTFPNNKDKVENTIALLDDKKGNIWVAGFKSGLYKINKEQKSIKHFELKQNQNQFQSIAIDKDGMLWIGTFDSGLLSFDPSKEEFQDFLLNNIDGSERINVIKEDGKTGNFWLGTENGIYKLNPATKSITKPAFNLPDNFIRSIFDDGSILWIGTTKAGVVKVIKKRSSFLHFVSPLSSPFMRGIIEDKDHQIWAGTDNAGINLLARTNSSITSLTLKRYFKHDPKNPNSISSNLIYPIFKSQENEIWIGSYGYGINRYNKSTDRFLHYNRDFKSPNQLSENRIYAFAEGSEGNIFVSTEGDPLSVFNKKTGQFKKYLSDQSKPYHFRTNIIRSFQKDSNGTLWIGTNNGGLYRFTEEFDGVIKYSLKESNQYFSRSKVLSFFIGSDTIWAGTDQGLFILKVPQEKATSDEVLVTNVIHLHENNYLPNNVINAILEDSKGNLWISTNKGLSVINRKTLTIRNYTRNDGLQSNEFDVQSYTKTYDGYFIFGGVNGLTIFHPDSIQTNEIKPNIFITELQLINTTIVSGKSNPHNIILNEDISYANEIRIEHNVNIINLKFAALDFTKPEKNEYAYQLVGFDQDWVYAGNRRTVTYTNLDPGTYTFLVKGSNNDGVWSEEATSLQIVILPPLWKTWWAYVIYSTVITLLAYFIWRRSVTRAHLKTISIIKGAEAETLREVDVLKSRFFANISHEFRTPLTLILNPLQKRIENTSDTEEKVELSVMQRNATRLLTLVNQLLDLSRAEAGTLKLMCAESDLYNAIVSVASQFSSMADSKGIHFKIDGGKPITLFVDLDKLEKIITNLLSNAFKFTPTDGTISLTLTEQGPSKNFKSGCAEIIVADTGTGIETEHLTKIFDRFYQVDMSTTRVYEGSGIGLSLTKELVELHHGTISVYSECQKGSTFIVRLPLGKDHLKPEEIIQIVAYETLVEKERAALPPTRVTEQAEDKTLTEESILIIEDNVDLRVYLHNELKTAYKIIEASDGEEGIRKALHEIPTLIISDLMMPKKDGLSVCSELKEDERTSHIPIILLTAKADIESKLTGLCHGADDYIAKPFNLNELQLRIQNLIAIRKKLQAKFTRQLTVLPSEIPVESADGRFLKKAVELIEAHLADSGFGVEIFAKELAVSQTQLYRKLQAVTGSGPNEFIRHIRLLRAADLLRKNAGNVSEIAYQIGFNNLSYFSKVFKEKFGVTPMEFLKNPSTKTEL